MSHTEYYVVPRRWPWRSQREEFDRDRQACTGQLRRELHGGGRRSAARGGTGVASILALTSAILQEIGDRVAHDKFTRALGHTLSSPFSLATWWGEPARRSGAC